MKEKDFKWFEENRTLSTEPVVNDIGIVTLPVKVLFEWSDKIVVDVDEYDNPVEHRSGYVMQVMPNQYAVFNGQPVQIIAHTKSE